MLHRWNAIEACLAGFAANVTLASIPAYPGWPGDKNIDPEMIWLSDQIEGNPNIPVFGGTSTPVTYDDSFTLPWQIRVAGQADLAAAGKRAGTLASAALRVLQTDSGLASITGGWVVIDAVVTEARGPWAIATPAGPLGFAELVVTPHIRVT